MVVYETTPIGNLEGFSVKRILPLQEAFQCNISACISIGVHDNSALLASEQGIVSTVMSLTNSTAVVAELGGMPTVYSVQCNILIEATGSEDFSEFAERHPHYDFVELLSFSFESLEILNRNVGIVFEGKVGYFLDHLTDICINKVELYGLQPSQGTKVIGRLHQRASSHYLLSPYPDIQSEVVLAENLVSRRDNSNGYSFGIEINAHDIPFTASVPNNRNSVLFGKISYNLEMGSQTISLASPSCLNQIGISLEVPILHDRNGNWILGKQRKLHKRHSHIKSLAVARNVEFEGNSLCLSFASPYIAFNIADNLRIERGAFFAG
jgi:hypothetical protein